MNFAEKLKSMRKDFGMSQEELADKVGVSRQAITKWETDGGMPDIENILAIATLFNMTVDDLLSNEKSRVKPSDFFYESVTEYDIDMKKHYDIHIGGAYAVTVWGIEGEKLKVRLASNLLTTLERSFKVKIDENKASIDIDLKRASDMSEAQAKEGLHVFIGLPQTYLKSAEVFAYTGALVIHDIALELMEFEGRAASVRLSGVNGLVELDSSSDLDIVCDTFAGGIGVNQISATSTIHIPQGTSYILKKKGATNRVSYTLNGKAFVPVPGEGAENIIKFTGLNAELVIDEYTV